MIGISHVGGFFDLLISGVLATIADVFANGAVEEPGILQDHGKFAAKVLTGEILDVDIVDQNFAAVDVIKRIRSLTRVVLPAPVGPTMAICCPGSTVTEKFSMTGSSGL